MPERGEKVGRDLSDVLIRLRLPEGRIVWHGGGDHYANDSQKVLDSDHNGGPYSPFSGNYQ